MYDPNGNTSTSQDDDAGQNKLRRKGGDVNNTLVVVKSVPKETPDITLDPLFQRINQIPIFSPIIDEQQTKRFPWSSKPNSQNVSSKINSKPLIRVGQLYNGYVRKNTEILLSDQAVITKKIKQVDAEIGKMMKIYSTKQKDYARIANKFSSIPDMSRCLHKSQSTLDDLLNIVQLLNHMLPQDEQLEPFEWSGVDDPTPSSSS